MTLKSHHRLPLLRLATFVIAGLAIIWMTVAVMKAHSAADPDTDSGTTILSGCGPVTAPATTVEAAWVRRYTGPRSYDDAYAMQVDVGGNVYVTGGSIGDSTEYDWLTIRYDSDGLVSWINRFDTTVIYDRRRDIGLAVTLPRFG